MYAMGPPLKKSLFWFANDFLRECEAAIVYLFRFALSRLESGLNEQAERSWSYADMSAAYCRSELGNDFGNL